MLKSRRTFPILVTVTSLLTLGLQHPIEPPSISFLEEIPKRTSYEEVDIMATNAHELKCPTPEDLQGPDDPRYNVSWTYNGDPQPWLWNQNTFRDGSNRWVLHSDTTEYGIDNGNYTCTVTSSDGTQVTMTFIVCLTLTLGMTEPPTITENSDTVFAKPGQDASFYCIAKVPIPKCLNPDRDSVQWLKWLPNGTATPLEPSSNVELTEDSETRGVLSCNLKLSSLKSHDFGVYSCNITSKYGSTLQNMTLMDGVPCKEREAGRYKAIMAVLLAMTFTMPTVIIFYNRLKIPWAMWRWKRYKCFPDGYDYDVYLIYGETASEWIWKVLHPRLRDYHYSCYILDRDMLGGENMIDSISIKVQKCRRVIVVLTPCLLESPWCAWAIQHAINAAMNTPTRMIMLELQTMNEMEHIPDPRRIRGMLKFLKLRKIRVPCACGLDQLETQQPKVLDLQDDGSKKSSSESTCRQFCGSLLNRISRFCATDEENRFWGTLCLRLSSPLKTSIYAKERQGENGVTHV